MKIISGSTHKKFALKVAERLQMSITNTNLSRHPDSETAFEINESIREKHSPQIQGFFNIGVDNLFAEPLIMKYIKELIPNWKTAVIVSPDAGEAKRATSMASKLGLDLAIIHKQKNHLKQIESTILVGDVRDKSSIIVDDMADSCHTLVKATDKLKESGATRIYA
ncbi:unnamed protein product [Oppiella nova]|uniref:ribose-phosphate diphosphokinase n=1 Tax=Oppiella nova TaxID=334625 RepID=A0A7R9LKZ2_9ACAR|nr:unnamed protein product [Oppiella nova]CAG2164635.1 unnamed protein product [Oppiella nova]